MTARKVMNGLNMDDDMFCRVEERIRSII